MEQHCGFSPLQSAGEAGPCTGQSSMSLSITSTTGSPVELTVPPGETVDSLRTRISQKPANRQNGAGAQRQVG